MQVDRRRFIRHHLKCSVTVVTSQGTMSGQAQNLSGDGALICCKQPLTPRKCMDLTIKFSDGFSLEVPSEVVWYYKTNAGDEKSSYKMGVRFLRWEKWGEQPHQWIYLQLYPKSLPWLQPSLYNSFDFRPITFPLCCIRDAWLRNSQFCYVCLIAYTPRYFRSPYHIWIPLELNILARYMESQLKRYVLIRTGSLLNGAIDSYKQLPIFLRWDKPPFAIWTRVIYYEKRLIKGT